MKKKKNLKVIQDLSEDKTNLQNQILAEIKDTEKLKIEQNELSQNNIIEYQKKIINLEDQLKDNCIEIKEKNNPCNNDNDLITILQTKIKKSNLNKNKSLIEKIENDIKDLNIKFIEDAQTVKNTQNNELEQNQKILLI